MFVFQYWQLKRKVSFILWDTGNVFSEFLDNKRLRTKTNASEILQKCFRNTAKILQRYFSTLLCLHSVGLWCANLFILYIKEGFNITSVTDIHRNIYILFILYAYPSLCSDLFPKFAVLWASDGHEKIECSFSLLRGRWRCSTVLSYLLVYPFPLI